MAGERRSVFAGSGSPSTTNSPTSRRIDGAAKKVRTFPSLRGAVDLDAVDKGHQAPHRPARHFAHRLRPRAQRKTPRAALRLSPRFAALSRQAGLGSDHMAGLGAWSPRVSGVVIGVITTAAAAAFITSGAFTADAMALRETSRAARVSFHGCRLHPRGGARWHLGGGHHRGAQHARRGLRAIRRSPHGRSRQLWRLGVRSRDTQRARAGDGEVLGTSRLPLRQGDAPAARLRLATDCSGRARGRC